MLLALRQLRCSFDTMLTALRHIWFSSLLALTWFSSTTLMQFRYNVNSTSTHLLQSPVDEHQSYTKQRPQLERVLCQGQRWKMHEMVSDRTSRAKIWLAKYQDTRLRFKQRHKTPNCWTNSIIIEACRSSWQQDRWENTGATPKLVGKTKCSIFYQRNGKVQPRLNIVARSYNFGMLQICTTEWEVLSSPWRNKNKYQTCDCSWTILWEATQATPNMKKSMC